MKKILYVLCILSLMILLSGCNKNPSYINLDKKPSTNYYCTKLNNDIASSPYKIKLLDMNMYKEIAIDPTKDTILKDFFSYVKKPYYVSSLPKEIEDARYKIYIETSSSKYLINVYDYNYISVQPWDGNFIEDYINQKEIPTYYNLYEYCDYMFNSPASPSL